MMAEQADRVELILSKTMRAITGFKIPSPLTIKQLFYLLDFSTRWTRTSIVAKGVTSNGYAYMITEGLMDIRPKYYDTIVLTPECELISTDDDGSGKDYVRNPINTKLSEDLKIFIYAKQQELRSMNTDSQGSQR